jgi:hypothetical protein
MQSFSDKRPTMSAAYPAMELSTSIVNNTLDKAGPNICFVTRSFIGVFKAVLTSSQVRLPSAANNGHAVKGPSTTRWELPK